MGLTSSTLPELAALALEVFHLPIILTLWFNDRTYSGFGIAGAGLFAWFCLRVGFNIKNPLTAPAEVANIGEATRIYDGWYILFILLGLLVGWLICLLMDMREPIPFYAIFPSFYVYSVVAARGVPICPIELARLKAYDCDCASRGLSRWCYERIEPPYWHVLVGIIAVLINVIVPAILFLVLFPNSKWWAFFVPIIMKVIGYIGLGLYWYYRTDLYVFGPTLYNTTYRQQALLKDRETSPFRYDPEPNTLLYRRTEMVVLKNILVIGLTDLVLFFIIGAILVFPSTIPSVNLVVGVGLAIIIILGLIFIVVALIFYTRAQPVCPEMGLSPCAQAQAALLQPSVTLQPPCQGQVCPYPYPSTPTMVVGKRLGQKHDPLDSLL